MKFRSFVLFRVSLNNVDMKNTVLQRIIDFSESVFLSKKKFAEAIGMEQTTVNNQLIGKRGLSIDLVLSWILLKMSLPNGFCAEKVK